MKFQHQIPSFYQNILPSEILKISLEEKKATCDSCAMARPRYRGENPYQENLKCCTFHPFLPNFLVGAILQDPSLQTGADVLRGKIEKREYALPIGMVAPVRYQLEFNAKKEDEFGQREDWLCPYYDRLHNNCTVWRYRGVICTTFFCKSSYGSKGKNFWNEMSDYLSYVEMALMEEALVQLDFSPRQVSELTEFLNRQTGTAKEKRSWVLPADTFTRLWNHYDDPEKFYKKTFEIVQSLDKESFREMTGELGERLEGQVFSAYDGLRKI